MEMWNIVAVSVLGGFGFRLGWVSADAVCDIAGAVFEAARKQLEGKS